MSSHAKMDTPWYWGDAAVDDILLSAGVKADSRECPSLSTLTALTATQSYDVSLVYEHNLLSWGGEYRGQVHTDASGNITRYQLDIDLAYDGFKELPATAALTRSQQNELSMSQVAKHAPHLYQLVQTWFGPDAPPTCTHIDEAESMRFEFEAATAAPHRVRLNVRFHLDAPRRPALPDEYWE